MVSNNVSKDNLSGDTSFWDILTTLTELHSQKRKKLGENSTANFAVYNNSMQKKDEKVGNKTANKEGKKESERERSK